MKWIRVVNTIPKTILTVSLILFLYVPPALAKQVFGKVISVADGDTITVLVDRTQIKVRLAEIDAPRRLNRPILSTYRITTSILSS